MQDLTPKQKKAIEKIRRVSEKGNVGILEHLLEIEDQIPAITDVISKVTGPEGKEGKPGKDGRDGKQGPKGERGDSGKPGKDGRDGKDGRNGRDGLDGENGRDGVDGTSANVEEIEKSLTDNLPQFGAQFRDGLSLLPKGEMLPIDAVENLPEELRRIEERAIIAGHGGGPIRKIIAGSNITVQEVGGDTVISSTASGGGGGAVDSVNGQTGVVVLDADDIDDTSTTNKFVTAADITKLSNLSGTNTGDVTVLDSSEIDFTLTGQQVTASLITGSIDVLKLDAGVQASLALADSSIQNLSDLGITADATELNYVDGVTSSIQTQLNAKLSSISGLDHNSLGNLTTGDVHTQYALLAGRSGGQTLYGDTAANGDITIHGTSNATRTTSYVLLQPTAGNVGIGTSSPTSRLTVSGDTKSSTFTGSTGGTGPGAGFYPLSIFGSDSTVGEFVNNGYNLVMTRYSADNGVSFVYFGVQSTPNLAYTFRDSSGAGQLLTINNTGNVGVGTSNPDGKFEVNLGTAGTMRLAYNDANGSAATYADFGVTSGGILTLNSTGNAFAPATSDNEALGSGTLMWSDLFLASGGVVNFNNGNYTVTHAAGKLTFSGEVELDGALNHDGTTVGFYGVTPTTQSSAYTASNVSADRTYDANATTIDELADVLGTLIADLKLTGIIG